MITLPARGTFLMDTGCFYALSGDRKVWERTRLLALHRRLAICPLPIIEIAAMPVDCDIDEFLKRRAAMQTVYSTVARFLPEFPEELTATAFGRQLALPFSHDVTIKLMRAVMLANSPEELESGVVDKGMGVVYKPPCADIRDYKARLDVEWRDVVARSTAWYRGQLAGYANGPLKGIGEGTPKQKARMLKQTAFLGGPMTPVFLIVLAKKVGAIADIEELKTTDTRVFLDRALRDYTGALNAYIRVLNAYMTRILAGGTAKRNDWLDLEFFKYLDSYAEPTCFVTTDKDWVSIGEEQLPGRFFELRSLLEALELNGPPWPDTPGNSGDTANDH